MFFFDLPHLIQELGDFTALIQLRMFFSTATGFMPVSCDLNVELSTLEDSLNSLPMRSGIFINHFFKQSFLLK